MLSTGAWYFIGNDKWNLDCSNRNTDDSQLQINSFYDRRRVDKGLKNTKAIFFIIADVGF